MYDVRFRPSGGDWRVVSSLSSIPSALEFAIGELIGREEEGNRLVIRDESTFAKKPKNGCLVLDVIYADGSWQDWCCNVIRDVPE